MKEEAQVIMFTRPNCNSAAETERFGYRPSMCYRDGRVDD